MVPGHDRGDCKKKIPGFPVCSTKVPNTTLIDASMTYKQSVSLETTDKDLKTNNFKDSLTKTCTYSDLLAVRVRSEHRGSGGSGTEHTSSKVPQAKNGVGVQDKKRNRVTRLSTSGVISKLTRKLPETRLGQ